ncbi:SGNH hydrolase-type esterase domain-containing protein [Xylogone sp. PMI_703]|nr:SGNH hydrolase-type esterase domain-containing protein [Xylogone sp. PMI_703]
MPASNPAEVKKVTVDKILLFGDSITEMSYNQEFGFNLAPALQHEYFRKLQVVARGYGGYTTEHARCIIGPTLDAEEAGGSNIRLITVFFGTNDASDGCLSLERYAQNLEHVIKMIQARNIPLIVVGPSLIDAGQGIEDKNTVRNLEFSKTAENLAKRLEVPFIDLWHAFAKAKGWLEEDITSGKRNTGDGSLRDLLSDGVHFTGEGYKIWYNILLRTVREKFPELRTENLPTTLPHIYDVDNSDLPSSLWQDVKPKGIEMATENKPEL